MASLVDNGLFSDCEKPAMCHWIGLHHMLVMFASQSHASAQMCTAANLWECTSALVSGHWSRWCLRPVFGLRSHVGGGLVECKSAADEKSKEWQWGLFNKVKLPQQNLFIATFCMLYTRIQIHSLTKYIWSTTPCFPIHVWTLWPTSPYPSMRSQSLSTFPKEPILSERGSNKLYLYSYFIFWYLYLYYCINVSERDGHSWSLNNFDITYFDSAEWA